LFASSFVLFHAGVVVSFTFSKVLLVRSLATFEEQNKVIPAQAVMPA
jgi:hypothetical protein